MIVDDCSVMRSLLRNLLRAENYSVIGEASNGPMAIEMLRKIQPDIICLDIKMPVMSGLDILKEIKTLHPAIEVIMITANSDKESVMEAISNGAIGFVVKPFSASKIGAALEKVRVKKQSSGSADYQKVKNSEPELNDLGSLLDDLPSESDMEQDDNKN